MIRYDTEREALKHQQLVGDVIPAKVTHYCACALCNGNDHVGQDAMGGKLEEGTIACNWLPFKATVKIKGRIYTVRDRMAEKPNGPPRFDVFVEGEHRETRRAGVFWDVPTEIVSLPR